MKPAHILLLVTGSHIGGAEKMVALAARSLDRTRFVPAVCSLRPLGDTGRKLADAGVEVFSLGFEGRGVWGAAGGLRLPLALAAHIKSRRIHLLHSFLFLANQVGKCAALLTGRPIIASIRVAEAEKKYHLLAERLTARLADRYLVPSRYLAGFASRAAGIPEDRIVVIPNAVEIPPPAGGRLRSLLAPPPGRPLAGFVGRLHRQKGLDILLEAMAALPAASRPYLAVIGDGPEREALEGMSRRLGLASDVCFPGWLPSAARIMGDLDLLLLPSRWEGAPNVVLEAMAAGVPVAAAALGGMDELIEDGVDGLLFPPGDRGAISRLLAGIAGGGLDLSTMAAAARRRVEREHDPAAMIRRFEDLYATMLATQEPAS